jgi:hypothetical protein
LHILHKIVNENFHVANNIEGTFAVVEYSLNRKKKRVK